MLVMGMGGGLGTRRKGKGGAGPGGAEGWGEKKQASSHYKVAIENVHPSPFAKELASPPT